MKVLAINKSALLVAGVLFLVMVITAIAYFVGNSENSQNVPEHIEIILPEGDDK